MTTDEPRPSKSFSVRLPAILIEALTAQLPAEHPSVNAWVSATLHDLIDTEALTDDQRFEWKCTARPIPRAGRK